MLHSRTKTVKAYGKRSNTRVINIHSDFHEAIRSEGSKPSINEQVLQKKTAHNAADSSSEDDELEEVMDGLRKERRGFAAGKGKTLKTKAATANKRAIQVDKRVSSDETAERPVEVSLGSSDSRGAVEVEDPSFRSTTPASANASASSPSSRPVLRNRRNGRKVVESSGESERGEDESADGYSQSESEMVELEEPEIITHLEGLSIRSETPLETLLALCKQESAHDFTSFVSSHSVTSASGTSGTKKKARNTTEHNVFRKIGEASYSEVFGVWSGTSSGASPRVVMKVVPLDLATISSERLTRLGEETDEDEVCLTRVEDVIKEIGITRLMDSIHEGFVKLHEAHVVRGAYPQTLLESWDAFKAERGSESRRPGQWLQLDLTLGADPAFEDCLPANQHFLLLFLENAGTDLESYKFDKTCGWRQAVDVLWQVADSLATAEKEAEFEHRDLHEGQVLLSESETGELRATIIDFGLSRAKSAEKQELFWSKIPEDVFDGQGEQWDIYRAMKAHIETSGDDWDGFHPVTNLMWLHYLTKRLLYATPTLVKPRSKALSRVISRRDPSRSPIRRRTTRTTAALGTPMPTVSMDQGAELEAWEKLRCFEAACKAGLLEVATEKQAGVVGKGKPVRGKTQARGGAKASGTVRSVKDATLWFVANE